MSQSPSSPERNEKMRLCPSCRMEISVLATKCRFCGESVGRPRDETRALTIDDLGGETIRHYAPSSSVMEAMEAFRSENEFSSNPPEDEQPAKKTLFGMGKKKFDSNPPSAQSGLPELDERSQALASLAIPSMKPVKAQRKPKTSPWPRRAAIALGVIAGLGILWFGGSAVWAYMTREPEERDPLNRNPAEAMLARDEDPVKTLVAAAEAFRADDHSKNRMILEKARERVKVRINELLNAKPWSEEKLNQASREMNTAFRADSAPDLRALKEEVDREGMLYRMTLLDTKPNEEATFALSSGANGTVTVKLNEEIADRFRVVSIRRDSVQVQDKVRGNRPLTYSKNETRIQSP